MAKFEAPEIKDKAYKTVLIFGKLRGFVQKMLLEGKVLLSKNFFHTNLLILSKIQTVINSHSSMIWTSNMAILIFSTCSFHFWHFLTKIFLKGGSHDGWAAKGLWCYTVWHSNLIFKEIWRLNIIPVQYYASETHSEVSNAVGLLFYWGGRKGLQWCGFALFLVWFWGIFITCGIVVSKH